MVFETVVEAEDVAPVPPILDRLAEDQRGEVWAMSGSDHYVEILTSLGKSSVLLRFSDALREVEPIPGQRIHRSHWVSDDAVVTLRHEGKRLFVQLKTGDELPVSRTYVDDARRRWSNADTE
jgi:DNA-binding LytR/AlgR family response regulator